MSACPRPRPRILRLALLGNALLLGAALVAACGGKPTQRAVAPLSWKGFFIGQAQAEVTQRFKDMGWSVGCEPADSVVFLEGSEVHSRWVLRSAKERNTFCQVERKDNPKAEPRFVKRLRMQFLDGRLVRLSIKITRKLQKLRAALQHDYPFFVQEELTLFLFREEKPGRSRAFTVRQGQSVLIWMRSRWNHELILADTRPQTARTIRGLSSAKRGK